MRPVDRAGFEALLLRRHARAGFVPGAWVFPGGRVDPGDALEGYWPDRGAGPPTPDAAFWVAAVREVFEETGVLLASGAHRPEDARLQNWREALLADRVTLLDVLREENLRLDSNGVIHIAHWITPRVEPRRYDTHFFLTALSPDRAVDPDAREMTDALWLRPHEALERHAAGRLPMVFPTVKVLGQLAMFDALEPMFTTLRGRDVPTIMPELVRTPEGVGFVLNVERRG